MGHSADVPPAGKAVSFDASLSHALERASAIQLRRTCLSPPTIVVQLVHMRRPNVPTLATLPGISPLGR